MSGGGGSGWDVELGEDVGDVGGGGPPADAESRRDLFVGASFRHQDQHLVLARGQGHGDDLATHHGARLSDNVIDGHHLSRLPGPSKGGRIQTRPRSRQHALIGEMVTEVGDANGVAESSRCPKPSDRSLDETSR